MTSIQSSNNRSLDEYWKSYFLELYIKFFNCD